MSTSEYTETQQIELATAQAFFALYNVEHGTSYVPIGVASQGEVPDVLGQDEEGNKFNLEITLTEDHPGDIASILGRSDKLSVEVLRRHLQAVRAGGERLRVTSLQQSALPILLRRLDKKLTKRYGPWTALVIRDTSPLWNWEDVIPIIREYLDGQTVPFDLGVWLLSFDKAHVLHLYPSAG